MVGGPDRMPPIAVTLASDITRRRPVEGGRHGYDRVRVVFLTVFFQGCRYSRSSTDAKLAAADKELIDGLSVLAYRRIASHYPAAVERLFDSYPASNSEGCTRISWLQPLFVVIEGRWIQVAVRR
jgi:hypothetical protein